MFSKISEKMLEDLEILGCATIYQIYFDKWMNDVKESIVVEYLRKGAKHVLSTLLALFCFCLFWSV